ncbi:MAG: ATP-binding protein [Bacteroidales bacterium]|nr:ATP-binding protein [Bacteroidales bacterium]
MSEYIYKIIEEGEHEQLDFKFEVNDARKIAITLASFSNTKGGKLLIGVKDNGKIKGIKTEEEFYMLDLAANHFCKPIIKLKYSKWIVEGKTILEADVPEGIEKPYYAKNESNKWLAYFRQDDQNHLANIIQLNVWKNYTRNRGILFKYSRNESKLLNYLANNESVTLNDFIKLANIQRRTAVNILSKLVSFGLIEIIFLDGKYNYFLKDL